MSLFIQKKNQKFKKRKKFSISYIWNSWVSAVIHQQYPKRIVSVHVHQGISGQKPISTYSFSNSYVNKLEAEKIVVADYTSSLSTCTLAQSKMNASGAAAPLVSPPACSMFSCSLCSMEVTSLNLSKQRGISQRAPVMDAFHIHAFKKFFHRSKCKNAIRIQI